MKHLWVFLSVFLVTSSAIGVSHGAEKVVNVDSFDWSYVTSQQESRSLTIKLVANIDPRCDSVSGQNLWKVDVFGSESQDGSGERYGYVEQILNQKQTCKTVKKGSVFKLKNLRTPFDVDGVSCGNASFLCVELAKNRDSSVNFELRYGGHVNSVVDCKPFECTDPRKAAAGRIKKVVNVVRCFWIYATYATSQQESSSTSTLRINLQAKIARGCDSVRGQNLWRVGLFGSESHDGSGERYGYVEQILDKKQISKTVNQGSFFRLNDLWTPFDVDGVSCGNASFLCVELAKNRNSSVNFELRYGGHVNSVVVCYPLECTESSIPVTERNVQVHYIARLFFTNAHAYVRVINSRPGQIQELSIELNFRVHGDSDRVVGGRNMWRVNVYGSRNYYGYETQKLGYTSKALISNDTNYSPDIIPGQTIAFPEITTEFNATGMGCGGQYRYICIELERDTNSEPDFKVWSCGNRKKIVACASRYFCLDQLISIDEFMKRYW